ncbi:MAG: DUF4390 domain-containing protein [Gammaproteobacteria bacterium]|nr:DUF4390 domain-containing protein [Gammaproteobacteria bacterium]
MRVCTNNLKPAERSKTCSGLLLLILCGFSMALSARGITVDSLDSEKVDNQYLLSARVTYTFSEEVLKALEHGVALYFNVQVKTSMKRPLLWDKIIKNEILKYRLEYHPLSQRYLLTDYKTFDHYDFRTLEAALNSMGSIRNFPVTDTGSLSEDGRYQTSIRVSLDGKSLPAPLRPLSYISPDWRLSSNWVATELRP